MYSYVAGRRYIMYAGITFNGKLKTNQSVNGFECFNVIKVQVDQIENILSTFIAF